MSPLLLHVSCYFVPSFLKLEVTRTCIISCMSSNPGQMGPRATELAALERLKIDVSTVFGILESYKDMHKLLDGFLFRPDPTTY